MPLKLLFIHFCNFHYDDKCFLIFTHCCASFGALYPWFRILALYFPSMRHKNFFFLCIVLSIPNVSRTTLFRLICICFIAIMIGAYPRHWVAGLFLPQASRTKIQYFNILWMNWANCDGEAFPKLRFVISNHQVKLSSSHPCFHSHH